MSNDYFAVFLYRWDDENDVRDASTVSYGEQRSIKSHYPSTVIGVATRPRGTTIDHDSASPEYEQELRERWKEHVTDVADDVRWFDEPMDCTGEA
jgi:hypothetical protein